MKRADLRAFVATLPADLKDELLLRVARREAGVGLELVSRFHQSGTTPVPAAEATGTPSPSSEELIDEAERVKSERERQVQIRRQREAATRKRAEDERRQRRLDDLADDWDHHWRRVFEAIDERQRRAYRRAAALMAELGEAARNPAQAREFGEHARTLRDVYANRPALMQEMDKAGLPGE